MHLSGEVAISDRLPANAQYIDITNSVTGFYFTDGIAVYRYGDSRIFRYYFSARTDADGRITSLWGSVEQWQKEGVQAPGARLNLVDLGTDAYVAYNASCPLVDNNVCTATATYDLYASRGWASGAVVIGRFEGDRTPVYRFFSKSTQSHFFTANIDERNSIAENLPDYSYEGVAFYVYASQADMLFPVYRLYPVLNQHFFTMSQSEAGSLVRGDPTIRNEGVGWFAMNRQFGSNLPVYRFFNRNTNTHFYTISEQEAAYMRTNYPVVSFDGVAYRAWGTRR
jgi:hypothetical protein